MRPPAPSRRACTLERSNAEAFVAALCEQDLAPSVAIEIEHVQHEAILLAADIALELEHPHPAGWTQILIHDLERRAAANPERGTEAYATRDPPFGTDEVERRAARLETEGLQIVGESAASLGEPGVDRLPSARP